MFLQVMKYRNITPYWTRVQLFFFVLCLAACMQIMVVLRENLRKYHLNLMKNCHGNAASTLTKVAAQKLLLFVNFRLLAVCLSQPKLSLDLLEWLK